MMTRKDYTVIEDIVKSFTMFDRVKVGIKVAHELNMHYDNFDIQKFYKHCGLDYLVCSECGSHYTWRVDDDRNEVYCETCGRLCTGIYPKQEAIDGL